MRHVLIKKKTWFFSPPVAILLVICVGWGMVAIVRTGIKQREALRLRNEARAELAELEQVQQDLEKNIQNLSTEEGIEAEIRQRYRVVKPGEQLVILVDNGDQVQQDTKISFWQKIRAFVGL